MIRAIRKMNVIFAAQTDAARGSEDLSNYRDTGAQVINSAVP